MPTMGDKLREARETYARMSEAAQGLEQAAEAAGRQGRALQRQLADFSAAARREQAALESAAAEMKWTLRRPLRTLFLLLVLAGFFGSLLDDVAARFLDWMAGLAAR